MRVGFIGLGLMGAPMSRNLLKAGHSVRAWNRTSSKVDAFVADGGEAATSPADAAAGAEVVITMVTDSPDVEAAYRLFVDVWERKRMTVDDSFFDRACSFDSDLRFFEGILDDAVTWQQNDAGRFLGYDYHRVWRFLNEDIGVRDPDGVARTWVVVLAALLMDYRYMYL